MKYNKILLIAPALFGGKHLSTLTPRTGIAYISEALINAGFEVSILDMCLNYGYNDIIDRINEFKPALIGFTFMTLGYKNLYKLINDLKKKYPETGIVAGGPHVSTLREKVLKDCEGLDYGIILEGDRSIVELCKGTGPENIQGLIYRKDGSVTVNPFNNFIEDLDSIPFPKYKGFELEKYPVKQIGILTSRGCPYNCTYCPVIAAIGKKFRSRSAQNVFDEIEYWYNKGYRELLIIDDNFTMIKKRTQEICELLKKKNFKGISLKCPNGIRADRVDYELLKLMREAGFDMLAFGVESANDKVLENIKKGEKLAVIEQRIKEACELGFDVDLFFLIGSPGESMDEVKNSFSLALRYPVRSAKYYNVIPFPTTELFDWIKEKNYFLYPPEELLNNASHFEGDPYFYSDDMSASERKKAFKMGQKVTRTVRRRHIERKVNLPEPVKSIFSWVYTSPVIEDLVINNGFFIKIKEKIKLLFFQQ